MCDLIDRSCRAMGLAFPSELTNDYCISGTSGKAKLHKQFCGALSFLPSLKHLENQQVFMLYSYLALFYKVKTKAGSESRDVP